MRAPHLPTTLLVGLSLVVAACSQTTDPTSSARKISTRTDLVGGPSALGEVGDYLLENEKIRVVIQDKGFSRGFGVYGGSLIDADLVRPVPQGGPAGGTGRDQFGELFPVFFLQALVPDKVEVVADGSDGGPARVRVTGSGGEFLTLTRALNQAMLNSHELPKNPLDALNPSNLNGDPQLTYSVVYELRPGERVVRMETKLTNMTDAELEIPNATIGNLISAFIGGATIRPPIGAVVLFGAGNKVFGPGIGHDIRWSLEESYKADVSLPAFPGLITRGLVSTSRNGVSYGYFALADPNVDNFAKARVDGDGVNIYEKAYGAKVEEDSLLLPFVSSAFMGAFYAQVPEFLEPGGSYAVNTYFIIGDGDVASVMDVVHDLRGTETGELRGRVTDELTGAPVEGASVIAYDAAGEAQNQMFTDAAGHFVGKMPAGAWTVRVEKDPVLSEPVATSIAAGASTFVELSKPATARIAVQVRDSTNRPLPAKVSVVGTIPSDRSGTELRKFLFDLEAGQRWRVEDVVPDDPGRDETRRYIERYGYTEDGAALLEVPPDVEYEVYISRGIEYDVHKETVRPSSGKTTRITAQLNRVVDTSGWISGDFHLHADPSLDSDISLRDRVITAAGEGLEYLVATDHNFVTDYGPTIERAGLESWVSSMVGIELTTLESGHFNGFPLTRDVGAITKGSFEWSLKPPGDVFREIRARGAFGPANTIVQANHARDSILGYFSQFDLHALTGEIKERTSGGLDLGGVIAPSGPAFVDAEGNSTFSFDFDAMELLNGGLPVQLHHGTMPHDTTGIEIPEDLVGKLPEGGTVFCEDGDVAFPGVIDDWFNFLNLDRRYVGLANSDSHHDNDVGYPRTFFKAATDDPAFISEMDVVDALKSHQAIMTNGPFVEAFVDDEPIGSKITTNEGAVEVLVKVKSAPWVQVDRGVIFANGEEVSKFEITLTDGSFERREPIPITGDTWFVVEVTGSESLFPMYKPVDVPPLLLNEAFESLAGPLGLSTGTFGDLEPQRRAFFTALALTNPIWVDQGGDGFTARGVLKRKCKGFGLVPDTDPPAASPIQRPKVAERVFLKRQLVPSFAGFPRIRGDITDVRVIFEHFGAHSH